MKKKILSLALALTMVATLLAGCGGGSTSSSGSSSGGDAAASAGEKYTLKMHLSVGTTDPVYAAGEKFAQMVNEGTDGNVTVELYASSSLGNTADCLEGLSLRACDVVFDSMANMASLSELANVDAAPYMYSSVDHFRTVWEGEVGATIRDAVSAETGMTVMGGGLQGVRVMTTTKPVRSVADVKGFKLRVPTIPIYLDTWEWLGASTTPLPGSEIFTAIQQGTVDGQENPYASSASLSAHEVCNYVTETNHVYSVDVFVMDTNFFNSLPADYQEAIQNAAAEASVYCTNAIEELSAEKKQIFVDAGCEIIEVDLAEWQAALDGFLEAKYPALVEYVDMIKSVDPAA